MSTKKIEKTQKKIYFPQDLIDYLNNMSSELDISATKFVEIATYHLLHCTPEERAAIIAKYFDPNWPPKGKGKK